VGSSLPSVARPRYRASAATGVMILKHYTEMELKKIRMTLNTIFIVWFVPMAMIILNIASTRTELYQILLSIHTLAAVALFVALGFAANYCNRNWVKFGLLPIFIPIIGPIVSYVYVKRFLSDWVTSNES